MTQLPSFGVVTNAVGHRPMPFAECLVRIATGIAARHFVNVMHAPAGEEVAVLARNLRYLKALWQTTAARAVA